MLEERVHANVIDEDLPACDERLLRFAELLGQHSIEDTIQHASDDFACLIANLNIAKACSARGTRLFRGDGPLAKADLIRWSSAKAKVVPILSPTCVKIFLIFCHNLLSLIKFWLNFGHVEASQCLRTQTLFCY